MKLTLLIIWHIPYCFGICLKISNKVTGLVNTENRLNSEFIVFVWSQLDGGKVEQKFLSFKIKLISE